MSRLSADRSAASVLSTEDYAALTALATKLDSLITNTPAPTDGVASGNITTQNLVPAGTATAGSAVEIATDGKPTVSFQVTGTYTGALSAQATIDGSTWVTINGILNVNTGAFAATVTSAANGIYQVESAGFEKIRITALAAVTGTAVLTLRATGRMGLIALDAPIPAGTNVIGSLATNQSTNINQVGGNNAQTNNGTAGNGVLRVCIASNNTAFNVITTPATPTTSFTNSAASTNATLIKNTAGTVWDINASNINAAVRYLKIYNKATAPTVGTDIPVLTIPIPAGGIASLNLAANGIRLDTGIGFALTSGAADTDTGAVSASEHKVAISYT